MRQGVTEQGRVKDISLKDIAAPTDTDLKHGEVLVEIDHVSMKYRDIEGNASATLAISAHMLTVLNGSMRRNVESPRLYQTRCFSRTLL